MNTRPFPFADHVPALAVRQLSDLDLRELYQDKLQSAGVLLRCGNWTQERGDDLNREIRVLELEILRRWLVGHDVSNHASQA